MLVNNCTKGSITSLQYKRMMPELISELLASGVAAIIVHFLMFGYLTPSPRVISLLVQLQPSGDTRVINVELMRSVFVRSNKAASHLLCSPRGAWGGLPQSLTVTLPPFLVLSGILRNYLVIMGCSLSFSLLRSALMCLRGSRSRAGSPGVPIAVAEGHLATNDV